MKPRTPRPPRTGQQLALAGLLVLFTMVLGTLGYILIEGWGFSDAFYMTGIPGSPSALRSG
ncbi:MAG: hypothetical protein GVY29_02810 [Spirochaetes bacterium]|nr:hypothetical protein [Spirochaetota bacterium]